MYKYFCVQLVAFKNTDFENEHLLHENYLQDKSLSRKRVMPNDKNEAVVIETDSLGRSRNVTYHATFDQVSDFSHVKKLVLVHAI